MFKNCEIQNTDYPPVKVPPPAVYIGGLLAGTVLHYFYHMPIMSGTISVATGVLLSIAGAGLHIYSIQTLKEAGTTFHVHKSSTVLVRCGPYKYSRNPIYFAMGLEYLGLSLILNSLWAVLFVIPVFVIIHIAVVKPEERYLQRTFGSEFQTYARQVSRWF